MDTGTSLMWETAGSAALDSPHLHAGNTSSLQRASEPSARLLTTRTDSCSPVSDYQGLTVDKTQRRVRTARPTAAPFSLLAPCMTRPSSLRLTMKSQPPGRDALPDRSAWAGSQSSCTQPAGGGRGDSPSRSVPTTLRGRPRLCSRLFFPTPAPVSANTWEANWQMGSHLLFLTLFFLNSQISFIPFLLIQNSHNHYA